MSVLVTGLQASGKSTVGALLARQLPRSAFIEGDLLWKMVVGGREDWEDPPSDEALHQLHLRYRHGAMLADSFEAAGFAAVHSDIVLEQDLVRYTTWATNRPLRIVVLAPSVDAIVEREAARAKTAYRGNLVVDEVRRHHLWLDRTPRIGAWVDSSDQTPDETVAEILDRWDEAAVT